MPYLAGYATPQDYGAVGDGVTDDTAAFQAAANAMTSGGVVFVPPTTNGYLFNSATISINNAGVVFMGQGPEVTKLIIGASFTGAALFTFNAYSGQVKDLSIVGASSTTTSNPVANGIEIVGVRRTKIVRVYFANINGWCIEPKATSTNGTSNPNGTQILQCYASSCAGGIHFLGNTTQGFAMNSQVTDFQFYLGGVTSGGSANLDGIRVEDAWDVEVENPIVWMSSGTGSAMHVKGNCAATFITNLDVLGPSTGPNVLIEDSANGSVQDCQITNGVIQQGSVGLSITGGSNNIHVTQVRFISNQTHGVTVSATASPVHLSNCFFNLNGAGATGTNYDVNWSGTAKGHMVDCWFGTNIVAVNSAGVQNSINVTAAQAVTVENAVFAGTGASSANWFTALPTAVLETGSKFNFASQVNLGLGATMQGNMAAQPSASGNTVLSSNTGGVASFDLVRLLGTGQIAIGPGTAARDAFFGRAGTNTAYSNPNFLVGAQTALGDNGSGELQIADATTKPTSVPTAGTVVFSQSGSALPLIAYTPNGSKQSMVDAFFVLTGSNTTFTLAAQTATTVTLAVESSATYIMEAAVIFSNTTGITTPSWTGPTGATMQWNDTTGSLDYSSTIGATNNTFAANAGTRMAIFKGYLVTAGTAGSLTLTLGVSTGTTTLFTGSWLKLSRLK